MGYSIVASLEGWERSHNTYIVVVKAFTMHPPESGAEGGGVSLFPVLSRGTSVSNMLPPALNREPTQQQDLDPPVLLFFPAFLGEESTA